MEYSISPKYVHLVQKPDCCSVTCLSMILYHRGFGLFDQQKLAKYFDVRVGKKEVSAFNIKLKTYNKTNCNEGMKTIDSENLINKFFGEEGIPLLAKAIKYSEITDFKEFLISNLLKNNDIWIEYKAHNIFKKDMWKGKYIHDSLVESFTRDEVVIVDPLYFHKPRSIVKINNLKEATSPKYGRETGFIIITKKK